MLPRDSRKSQSKTIFLSLLIKFRSVIGDCTVSKDLDMMASQAVWGEKVNRHLRISAPLSRLSKSLSQEHSALNCGGNLVTNGKRCACMIVAAQQIRIPAHSTNKLTIFVTTMYHRKPLKVSEELRHVKLVETNMLERS